VCLLINPTCTFIPTTNSFLRYMHLHSTWSKLFLSRKIHLCLPFTCCLFPFTHCLSLLYPLGSCLAFTSASCLPSASCFTHYLSTSYYLLLLTPQKWLAFLTMFPVLRNACLLFADHFRGQKVFNFTAAWLAKCMCQWHEIKINCFMSSHFLPDSVRKLLCDHVCETA
jgi:hypothetical protein